MTLKKRHWQRAIPAVLAGMAFFLTGCQTLVPVKGKVKPGESAPALQQRAEGLLKAEQYQKALALFKKISAEYPDYAKLSTVRYQIAGSHYLAGEYQLSADEAFRWLEKYPRHPEKKDIMLLLGENFEALGDNPQAFYWFLEAKKECFDDPQRQTDLDERLLYLIKTSGIEDIDQLEVYATGTHYAPSVRHRRAMVLLEQDDLEKARDIAASMVQDSREQSWVSEGMALLSRIQEEMTVKKGVVGCLLPLSGPFAIYGEEVLKGIQLGIFNGSEQAPELELLIKDTKDTQEHALAGLEDLAHNEKVMAVIGPLSSKTAAPVAKRAQELGVPIITLTQKEGITEEGDMVFRNFLTPSREVKRILAPSIIDMGIKRFAILYPDNSYGRFFMNLFWDRIEEIGGTITAVESYQPDKTDFADQVKKMTGVYYPKPASLIEKTIEMRSPEEEECRIYPDKPEPFIDFDAVFIPDNYQRVAMIAPQLPYHDVQDVLLMGTSLWQSPQLIETARNYIQGAIFPSGFFEGSGKPEVRTFITDYKTNFDSAPGMLAAVGYDTIRLMQQIMGGEAVNTRKDIRNELFCIQEFKGVTGPIAFDPQGELLNEPFLLTVSGRRMRLVR
ncbi:MAG: ABC transporter substrate-binding protein [Deltaproteobacteria bacterium]|nr:ABC transporter substrate-binding protein [Deltaproteobacteria bacterium]